MKKLRVGVVGCGKISGIYFKNIPHFDALELSACADLNRERADAAAKEYKIPRVLDTEALLSDKDIDVVLNLTVPQAHVSVNLKAIENGKHVFVEKPFALSLAEGQKVLDLAKQKGVLVGCAPDTVLGGGYQTVRRELDAGAIGRPTSAMAFMLCHGHESWHPDPEFYYLKGGGPMLDMGPYYITALVTSLGPVRRVSAETGLALAERTITSQPKSGKKIPVEVPTHQTGTLLFDGGIIATVVMSFDIWAHHLPRIEIHGTTGSLSCPDPNTFGGKVEVYSGEKNASWREMTNLRRFNENSRGLGLADLAQAVQEGRAPRASGELALHVLEVMLAFDKSSKEGKHVNIGTRIERPAPRTDAAIASTLP
ncbi:MAG: Gfo/Idh/MocA family oxidoreductase [Lentisphaerae bacterium]|nr:Gfo/Idh/MocA family oxidoreductase [Lentisphaerota bacterium]